MTKKFNRRDFIGKSLAAGTGIIASMVMPGFRTDGTGPLQAPTPGPLPTPFG